MLLTLPALQTKTDTFANSVDPDEMVRLIRIYTDCLSVLALQLSPFWQQWMCPNVKMEEPISETRSERVKLLLTVTFQK